MSEHTVENTYCGKCFHPIIEHHPFLGCVYGPDTSGKRCGCKALDMTDEVVKLINNQKDNENERP